MSEGRARMLPVTSKADPPAPLNLLLGDEEYLVERAVQQQVRHALDHSDHVPGHPVPGHLHTRLRRNLPSSRGEREGREDEHPEPNAERIRSLLRHPPEREQEPGARLA